MGFLLGAFGKLAAGSRYRSLQAKMMRIQSRLRVATRQASDMEKLINRQEKLALNNLTSYSNTVMNSFKGGLYNSMQSSNAKLFEKVAKGSDGLTSEESNQFNALMAQYNSQVSTTSSSFEQNTAYQKQQIQDYFEQMRDSQLQPLKDEEDLLQSEKDSLESQIQIAKADYEACQKMEQADAKMMTPNYTGGQG